MVVTEDKFSNTVLPILLLTSLTNISSTVNNVSADIGHRRPGTRYYRIITLITPTFCHFFGTLLGYVFNSEGCKKMSPPPPPSPPLWTQPCHPKKLNCKRRGGQVLQDDHWESYVKLWPPQPANVSPEQVLPASNPVNGRHRGNFEE